MFPECCLSAVSASGDRGESTARPPAVDVGEQRGAAPARKEQISEQDHMPGLPKCHVMCEEMSSV